MANPTEAAIVHTTNSRGLMGFVNKIDAGSVWQK